jgi:cell division protein FtsI (penicillin-binding protein 3)
VGFAPAEDPRLVLFVMIDEPQGTHYGSMVAGPVFQETMIDALRWLGVPPDAPVAEVAPRAAEGKPAAPALAGAIASLQPALRPAQGPSGGDDDEDGEDDGFVAASDDARARVEGSSEVPDFSGMSVSEALGAARVSGVRLEVHGSGIATAQSPGPGGARSGAACRVVFTPPG